MKEKRLYNSKSPKNKKIVKLSHHNLGKNNMDMDDFSLWEETVQDLIEYKLLMEKEKRLTVFIQNELKKENPGILIINSHAEQKEGIRLSSLSNDDPKEGHYLD